MNLNKIREEFKEHKNEYLYMMYVEYENGNPFYKVKDVNPDRLSWAEFVCNFSLYHKTLQGCINSVNGTRHPIIYKDKNINPIKESPFLRYNPYTGEVYREYYY